MPITAPGAVAEYVAAPADALAAAPRSGVRVRSYGADQVIDYTTAPLPHAADGQRFDAVLHLIRTDPQETARLTDLSADGGAFVSTMFPDLAEAGRGIRVVPVFARSDAAQLAELAVRVDAGTLKSDVAERRPMTDLAAVHDAAVAGMLPGKVILTAHL